MAWTICFQVKVNNIFHCKHTPEIRSSAWRPHPSGQCCQTLELTLSPRVLPQKRCPKKLATSWLRKLKVFPLPGEGRLDIRNYPEKLPLARAHWLPHSPRSRLPSLTHFLSFLPVCLDSGSISKTVPTPDTTQKSIKSNTRKNVI